MDLADQLLAEDDFAAVAPIESALQRAVAGISDADLKTEVKNQIREVAARREARERLTPAIEKLRQSPTDPGANLAVGSYVCFQAGSWDQGLPLLARSSDTKLRGLAAPELAVTAAGKPITQAADAWFDAAPKLAIPHRPGVMQHAAALYHRAEASATGLEKLAIEKRLAQMPPPSRLRRVDLLDLFDPATSIMKGGWRMQDRSLVCEPVQDARVDFAYEPPEEYDFQVSFTVGHCYGAVGQICYCDGHQFMYQLGGWQNSVSAFEMVNGVGGSDNTTARRKNRWLTDGQHYTSVVKVRKTGVEAYLDGQLITALKTNYSDMSLWGDFKLSRDDVVGISTDRDVIRFDSAEIIEITGEGKLFSP